MKALRIISLFAGIGGIDLGLERAGHECVGQVEFNPQCRAVLDHHWPGLLISTGGLFSHTGNAAIEDLSPSLLPPADAYFITDPCQRNTTANSRVADGRTPPSLWPAALRFVKVRVPEFVVRENPTRVRRDAPSPPQRVAADLGDLGYVATIIDLQAGQISGVSRQRTFVCAGLGRAGERLQRVLAEHRCDKRDWPKVGSPQIPLAGLTCHPYRYDNRDNFIAYPDGRIRVLSKRERLRAQGFPEDWLNVLGDVGLYTVARMMGNACPVYVARFIGRLLMALPANFETSAASVTSVADKENTQ